MLHTNLRMHFWLPIGRFFLTLGIPNLVVCKFYAGPLFGTVIFLGLFALFCVLALALIYALLSLF